EVLSGTLAMQRGLGLCEQGDAARGLLWLAHSLKIAPEQATDLQRDVRLNLARWHLQVHPQKARLRHGGITNYAAFSPDGKVFATIGTDNIARLTEMATGMPVGDPREEDNAPPPKQPGLCHSVIFSPDGKSLVTTCQDNAVRVWEAGTGRLLGA